LGELNTEGREQNSCISRLLVRLEKKGAVKGQSPEFGKTRKYFIGFGKLELLRKHGLID
jgi:hypothetical protein